MEREKEIEARLKAEVEKRGGWCLKFVSPGRAGVPDRLILLPGGRMAFVETKIKGGKPRPLQERVIGRLRNLGFDVWVLDDKKEIGKLLDAVASKINKEQNMLPEAAGEKNKEGLPEAAGEKENKSNAEKGGDA